MFRFVNRAILIPGAGFTLGVGGFMKTWPDEAGAITLNDAVVPHMKNNRNLQRTDKLVEISQYKLYQELFDDPKWNHLVQSERIPVGHRKYHVGQGELFGPGKLEIDPILFHNTEENELIVFYQLGKLLGNENGKVHKGVLSLLLDEALCYCGFPQLPSKRGVTAKLSINFIDDIAADSTVILRARVSQTKGRKCIIDGTLESVPTPSWLGLKQNERGKVFATANCILVEPKWFKYFNWVNMF